mgnify:CR=1 FL=1
MARRRKRREPETATITAVTHDGRGIADNGGKKAFVAGALEAGTGQRRLSALRWGLVPEGAPETDRGHINARAETAGQKPSFREAFARRRPRGRARGAPRGFGSCVRNKRRRESPDRGAHRLPSGLTGAPHAPPRASTLTHHGRSADAAGPMMSGRVEADHRGTFGQAVALEHRQPQFCRALQQAWRHRRAADRNNAE